jgi:hypothetical protein
MPKEDDPRCRQEEAMKEPDRSAWERLRKIAADLDPYWPVDVNAVEVVRDGRRRLVEQDQEVFWQELVQLAAKIGASWQNDMDAVDAVRDVRRDL